MQFIPESQLQNLWDAFKAHGYDRGKDDKLQLVGVRTGVSATNRFDDTLLVIPRGGGSVMAMDCTTDPGSYYLQHPMNTSGCAVLAPGQYLHAFAPGQHKGQYECLVQVEPVTVFRDKNADNVLDYTHPEKGMFGIHIHRANAVVKSKLVDRWSAGCTVIADPADFSELMFMVRDARKEGQERFTYTLLEESDLV